MKLMGFTGKLLVHPRHVEPVNQVFSPSKDEIGFASRVIKAYEEAKAKGLGATSIGGRMINYGSCRRAVNLIAISEKMVEREKRKVVIQAVAGLPIGGRDGVIFLILYCPGPGQKVMPEQINIT